MVRDLTRTDLRAIITRGLQETAGNYKMLVELFNMERTDYKRFLNFLRKQECQVPFAHFRAVSSWHRDLSRRAVPAFALDREQSASTLKRARPSGPGET